MAEKELLTSLRDEYLKNVADGFAHDRHFEPEIVAQVLDSFCQFSDNWLVKEGVIGVGHTGGGVTLRMASGDDLLLVKNVYQPYVGISVGVTGGNDRVSGRSEVASAPDVQITGRNF